MQNKLFKGTARSILVIDQRTHYVYHSTSVVIRNQDQSIVLNSGGFRTATTKRAMNQASNQFGLGFRVWQRAGEWFVTWYGNDFPFEDDMHLQNVISDTGVEYADGTRIDATAEVAA